MDGIGILTLVTFFPLVGVAAILLLSPLKRETDDRIRQIAIGTSVITFVIAVIVLIRFDPGNANLQMVERVVWIPTLRISYFLAVDGLGILFVMLTAFITPLAIISSWSAIQTQVKQYYIFMLLLMTGMIGVFLAQDLFLFYIFWEFTLIPMYFLIGMWGGERRVYASIKFFLYTMAGSLLMLLAILYLGLTDLGLDSATGGTFALPVLIENRVAFAALPLQQMLFLGFAIAFAIKVPIFPFHSWLPDAHTEAPTAGSVILAGVLLKMGTYGFIRFNLPLFPEASNYFAPLIAVLAIIGIIYGAIVSFAQQDVKKLVAYSSVSHLGFVMLGIFSLNAAGLEGAILQGVNHGLSTGALFFLVGILYEQRHTRAMSAFGGVAGHQPVNGHGALLADAVGAVGGLVLHCRVPPGVHVDDIVGGGEVEARTARLEADQEQLALSGLERVHRSGALLDRRGAVQVLVGYLLGVQVLADQRQVADELAEHQCLVAVFP